MPRLIDANALIDEWNTLIKKMHKDSDGAYPVDFAIVISAVSKAPTVDAVEVVHGRWEQVQCWATKAKYRCSVCGRTIMSAVKVNIEKYPYCHCGARMDGDGNA